jgi:C4-type Zn-finger protein
MHNSEDTWLACPICPISLDSAELLEHIGIMHSSENKWLECNKCPFSSDSVVIFTEHYKKHIQ